MNFIVARNHYIIQSYVGVQRLKANIQELPDEIKSTSTDEIRTSLNGFYEAVRDHLTEREGNEFRKVKTGLRECNAEMVVHTIMVQVVNAVKDLACFKGDGLENAANYSFHYR
jgi:hypothetical protein